MQRRTCRDDTLGDVESFDALHGIAAFLLEITRDLFGWHRNIVLAFRKGVDLLQEQIEDVKPMQPH